MWDIDPTIGLANLHGILAAKEAFKEYGLTVGCRADFFCVASETLAEAIVSRPARLLVVKSGRLVARDGKFLPSS